MKQFTNISFASVGMGISGLLAILFLGTLARTLGASDFGLYITIQTIVLLCMDIIDLSQNASFVRAFGTSPQHIKALLRANGVSRLKSGGAIVLAGVVLAYPLTQFFQSEGLLVPLILAFVGSLGYLIHGLVLSYFQVVRQFNAYALFLVLNHILRLVLWFAVLSLGFVSLSLAVIVFMLPMWIVGVASYRFLPKGFLDRATNTSVRVPVYPGGLTLFFLIAAVQSRVDVPLLLKLAGSVQAGVYGAAARIWIPALSIAGALSTVYAPLYAAAKTKQKVAGTTKSLLVYVLLLIVGIILALPLLSYPFALLGIAFAGSIQTAQWYGLAMIMMIAALPATTFLMYAVHATRFLVWVSIVQLAVMAIAGYMLVQRYGALGASWTVLAASSVGLLLLTVQSLRMYRKLPS